MTRIFIPILLAAVLALATLPGAFAQETDEDAAPVPEVVEPIAPYDAKMLRLSEVLGSIHYLRNLCDAREGDKWRDAMAKIIEAERPGPKRKARLIARFNRGYRALDGVYASCTSSALLASKRYVKEGAELSEQITSRYGR